MKVAIFLFLFVMLSLNVSAISVASDYLANNTMEIIRGASKIYGIRLQNPTENDVSIKLDYNKAFIKVIDYQEVYTLPPHTGGYKIFFNVTAPKEAGIYSIDYTVSEVEPSGGGGLPIRLRIGKNFKLKVNEEPKFHIKYEHVVYAAAILVFLLYVFIKARKKPEK